MFAGLSSDPSKETVKASLTLFPITRICWVKINWEEKRMIYSIINWANRIFAIYTPLLTIRSTRAIVTAAFKKKNSFSKFCFWLKTDLDIPLNRELDTSPFRRATGTGCIPLCKWNRILPSTQHPGSFLPWFQLTLPSHSSRYTLPGKRLRKKAKFLEISYSRYKLNDIEIEL